jgi:hypothetical protein
MWESRKTVVRPSSRPTGTLRQTIYSEPRELESHDHAFGTRPLDTAET